MGGPQPVSTSPLGGVPSVTDLVTTGPLTNWPTSLMDDCSTASATLWPGSNPCSAWISEQSVVTGVPFTAVITCATCNVEAAGECGAIPYTSAPALVEVTVYPRRDSAAAVAKDWACAIWRYPCARYWPSLGVGPSSSGAEITSLSESKKRYCR